MASRGRGRLGGGRNNNQPPLTFDQRAFIEAIGDAIATIAQVSVMATTISQAGAIMGQGGSSNLQRFKEHHLQPSRNEGTRWKLIIGFDKLERF